MGVATLVPVEEYLSTSYDPDCDYVDGELEDRNVGEKGHSKVQGNPRKREAFIYTASSMHEVEDGVLRTSGPDIAVPLSALFD